MCVGWDEVEGDKLGSDEGDKDKLGEEVGSVVGWDEVEGDELGSGVAPLRVGDGVDVGRRVGAFVGDEVVGATDGGEVGAFEGNTVGGGVN